MLCVGNFACLFQSATYDPNPVNVLDTCSGTLVYTPSVAWQDNTMTKPEYTKGDELRELVNLIDEIIQSHAEVEELPGPKAGYA
jgi:hypothetical protein